MRQEDVAVSYVRPLMQSMSVGVGGMWRNGSAPGFEPGGVGPIPTVSAIFENFELDPL